MSQHWGPYNRFESRRLIKKITTYSFIVKNVYFEIIETQVRSSIWVIRLISDCWWCWWRQRWWREYITHMPFIIANIFLLFRLFIGTSDTLKSDMTKWKQFARWLEWKQWFKSKWFLFSSPSDFVHILLAAFSFCSSSKCNHFQIETTTFLHLVHKYWNCIGTCTVPRTPRAHLQSVLTILLTKYKYRVV